MFQLEHELRHILNYLSRANDLYLEALPYGSAFTTLSDNLFTNKKTGESRIALEAFINHADNKVLLLEKELSNSQKTGGQWNATIF